jgi:hypothetical protein
MNRTASSWGSPPSRHYRFLSHVERLFPNRKPSLTVVGCADGKFVMPAARRGWRIFAVDVDTRMIDGCEAEPSIGVPVPVPGLMRRLDEEGLGRLVNVVRGDFMTSDLPPADALWTSGALQYSNNIPYGIEALTDRLGTLLHGNGRVYIEYMLPVEQRFESRPNCPPLSWWVESFPLRGWSILSHTHAYETPDGPHPYAPWHHVHSWGRLLAARKGV